MKEESTDNPTYRTEDKHSTRNNREFTTDHNTDHDSTKPLTCDHCEKLFVSTSDLHHHMKQVHSNGTTAAVPCPCCKEKFDAATELDRHLRDDHDIKQKILSCHSCCFRFVYCTRLNSTTDSVRKQ